MWKLLICCEGHTTALSEEMSALLISLHLVQYSEKFYRMQFLISHSWENLSFHAKKPQSKNIFLAL